MDEFGYLSVLLSIIIGLAVTEILQGMRRRMLSHAPVNWPTQVWAAMTLLVCAQTWWPCSICGTGTIGSSNNSWPCSRRRSCFTSWPGLVFPEFGGSDPVDLRAHYFRQRKRFFGLLVAATLTRIYRDWTLNHALRERTNLTFHLVFVAFSLSAIVTAREWYHKFVAASPAQPVSFSTSLLSSPGSTDPESRCTGILAACAE